MQNKKIILVGPSCSGKTYIRDKFREKGFNVNVSWTTRPIREGEKQHVDYEFIDTEYFESIIAHNGFYEWTKYGDHYYGTEMEEWQDISQIFIMETDGVLKINAEDRLDCLIIYVNTPLDIRLKRMKERGWSDEKISNRLLIDQQKFTNFNEYDLEISSEIHI